MFWVFYPHVFVLFLSTGYDEIDGDEELERMWSNRFKKKKKTWVSHVC